MQCETFTVLAVLLVLQQGVQVFRPGRLFRAPWHVRFQHIPNSRRNPNNRLVFSGEYGKINLSIYGKGRRIQAAAYLLKG
ncbi:hypothetical protein LI325_03935 [Enterocloster lavalensis]|nr:hypothetical protein [Enterocloster lavalensis]